MTSIASDAVDMREQLTRPERESAVLSVRATVREFDGRIRREQTAKRLPLFEPTRAGDVAKLRQQRSMIARQLCVTQLSLAAPG